jgi:diaminopimelate decarboxylase
VRDVVAQAPQARFGIRVLIDDRSRRNRIGLDPDEVPQAVREASARGGAIVGLHMYAGTNTRRPTRHLECLDRLLAVAGAVPELEYVDVGGGYGVGYREGEHDLDVEELGRKIALRIEELSERVGRRIRLVVEPGRALVASAGTLLVSVVSVKERGGRRYVGVDSTVGNIVVPSIYHVHHRVDLLADRGPTLPGPTDVCGNTTHSGDYLARDLRLPPVHRGDLLAFRDVGAYAYAMSSHFLNRPRPAEVALEGDAAFLTTRREVLSDLLALQQR